MRSMISVAVLLMAEVCMASPQDQTPAAAPPVAPADRSGQWIVVFPLTSDGLKDPWMSKAIQQTVFTDLILRSRAHVQSPQGEAPRGGEATLRAAREANATYAVSGDVQAAGNEIRVTGQVTDVASGNALGAFKATGPASQLFSLEDSVAAQVLRALPADLMVAPQASTTQAQGTQPQYRIYNNYATYSPPAASYPSSNYNDYSSYTYVYDSTPYGYSSYPYYSYPAYDYPYLGFGGVFIGGGGFHRGFGNEGFHRGFGGFGGGFRGGIGGGFRGGVGAGHAGGGHR